MRKNRTGRLLAGIIAVGALLAGCGDNDDMGDLHKSGGETAKANQADIAFAQDMIPHHEQAIEMATLAATRAKDQEVSKLAEQIEGAQDPEIKTMTGWLEEWGAPTGMDHGDMGGDMPGMMPDEDMAELAKATGATFDRMFLEMMIKHHEGAIEMSETELKDGQNADAKKLAQEIIDAQQAEIDTMNDLLGKS